jgi:hypothetical protein
MLFSLPSVPAVPLLPTPVTGITSAPSAPLVRSKLIMADRFPLIEKLLPLTPEGLKRSKARLQASREKIDSTPSFKGSRPAPVGPAQRREIPATLLTLEPRPLSAYDDNPVFDEITAARFLAVTPACLKKWRQRRQGPDYIQYGTNGPVRYELDALREFRDRYRVRLGN